MIWRSPWEAAIQNSTEDFFSRPSLAVLSHLTNDANATWYNKWYQFIDDGTKDPCVQGNFMTVGLLTPFWCTFDTVASKNGLNEPSIDWMI